jgi:hypothetical protein
MNARVPWKQNRICQTCPCYKSLDFVIRFGLAFSKGFNNQAHRSRVLFRTTGRGNITHRKKGKTKTLLKLSTIYSPPKNQSERITKDTTLTLALQVKNTHTYGGVSVCVKPMHEPQTGTLHSTHIHYCKSITVVCKSMQ